MKAAQIKDYGHADVVEVVEASRPKPGGGQVLVEIHAASINPFDTTVREGFMRKMIPLKLPVTLGGDIAGVIAGVGAGVVGFKVGDQVYGQANVVSGASGAFAEFAVTAAGQVAPMPAGLSFTQAAAAPLTGLSALQVVQDHIKLAPGQKILIHGGAGGIGTAAIQLAKHIGAYVAATATGEGISYVQSLGADKVIDYQAAPFETGLTGYDAVFDTVGGETYARSFAVLRKGGVIVSMLEQPNRELAEKHRVVAIAQQTRTTTAGLEVLARLIEGGAIHVHVDRVFPLDQIREAFAARESGKVRGKVVVEIKPA